MKTEKEKMLAGEMYWPEDPELIEERQQARKFTRLLNKTTEIEDEERQRIIEQLFGSFGENINMETPFRCDYGYNIHVGSNVFMNMDCVFLDVGEINIGDNCLIGPGVHIYTPHHPLNPKERLSGKECGKPVKVGNNVWIGGRAVINPGVSIGNDAVIASGAVVTKNVPSRAVVGGNPAKILKYTES
ncbi:maltose O-acetyltransferase [Alteribacillus persepolensis]|uniref:Maltose O-acetyltransferase n=1 Tax=Alteribacillus persepolensis TaxID=568899 RepID=A0A1G8H259_9BACI|nr:sugar O-acetyltransferase [Alteribacillus persepolensis]SDI00590.1 maltose O-acetyltransferase [Alteribacillus persepolensis]